MKISVILVAALFVACQTPAPIVPGPDASDASARSDAPAQGPTTPDCRSACDRAFALGCAVASDPNCGPSLTELDARRALRRPDGFAFTCTSAASAKTAADMIAAGIPCAP